MSGAACVSTCKNSTFVLQDMHLRMQEVFDPLICKFQLLACVKNNRMGPEKLLLMMALLFCFMFFELRHYCGPCGLYVLSSFKLAYFVLWT